MDRQDCWLRLSAVVLVVLAAGCTKPVLEGVVLQGVDNEPVPGAVVRIDGTTLSAVADAEGRYTIPFVPGAFTVIAEAVGHFAATRHFTVTEASRVPAAPLVLYPNPGVDGTFAAIPGLGLRRIPAIPLQRFQNLVETVSGIRDVAGIPGLEPGWRLFVVGASAPEVTLQAFAYSRKVEMPVGFGRREMDVDMWIAKGERKTRVESLLAGSLAEIVLPAAIEPGIYAIGGPAARTSTMEAVGREAEVVAFVVEDPDGFGPQVKPLRIPGDTGEWGDDFDTFADVMKLESNSDADPEFWVQCTLLSCGGSNCSRQCRITEGPTRRIVLPVYEEGGGVETFFDPQTLSLSLSYRLWRPVVMECQACPHHRELTEWRYDREAGRMTESGKSISVRHFDFRGMLPSAWNGAIRLDAEAGMAGIRLGSELLQGPDDPGVGPDGCVLIAGKRTWLEQTVRQIRACGDGGLVASIEVQGDEELQKALVRQFGVGQDGAGRRWEGERVVMTHASDSDGNSVVTVHQRQ